MSVDTVNLSYTQNVKHERVTAGQLADHYKKHNFVLYGSPNSSEDKIWSTDTVLINPPNERCKPQYQAMAKSDELLRQHFALAEEIMEYTHKTVPHSDNYHSRNLQPSKEHAAIYTKTPAIYDMRNKLEQEKKGTAPNSDARMAFQIGLKTARAAEKLGMGNCGELGDVGAVYAWEKHPHQMVEKAMIDAGDHEVVVIGRAKDSDPSNYKTWGPACVICDIWARTYFPASYATEELQDFKGTVYIEHHGRYHFPVVKPFNPETQKLRCIVIPPEMKQRILSANQPLAAKFNIPGLLRSAFLA